jgi:hypothetical protein
MALDHVLARAGADDDEFARAFLASGGIVRHRQPTTTFLFTKTTNLSFCIYVVDSCCIVDVECGRIRVDDDASRQSDRCAIELLAS